MNRDYYFFRHNYIIMVGAAGLVFVLCLFWLTLDIIKDDFYYFIEAKSIYGILMIMIASILCILMLISLNKRLKDKSKITSKTIPWRIGIILYYILLMIAVSVITAAGNYQVEITSNTPSYLNISLASALLLIPAVAPLPNKSDGLLLLIASIIVSFIPYAMPGAGCYILVQEMVLRFSIAAAYVVLWYRINRIFVLRGDIIQTNQKLSETNEEVVDLLISTVELRDMESGEHIKKVRDITKALALEVQKRYPKYNLSDEDIEVIAKASAMHDIGKIMIPDAILLKPGKLTEAECEVMKTHSENGFKILESAPSSWDEQFTKYSKDICLYHHEKYDGSGYPAGLKGDEIPIWAQIVSVADCFEALTSHRSYKPPYPPEKAYDMIMNGECGVFSDEILTCLTAVKDRLK